MRESHGQVTHWAQCVADSLLHRLAWQELEALHDSELEALQDLEAQQDLEASKTLEVPLDSDLEASQDADSELESPQGSEMHAPQELESTASLLPSMYPDSDEEALQDSGVSAAIPNSSEPLGKSVSSGTSDSSFGCLRPSQAPSLSAWDNY
jgi:hypothetical protein